MKTVVITGASTGIGRACALRMDKLGWRVLAGVRKAADGDKLRAEASDLLEPLILDVTKPEQIDAALARVHELGHGLHGLVNNAGVAIYGPAEAVPVDEYRRQFEINFFGQIAVTQRLMSELVAARGCIVNVTSVGGRITQPFMSPYCSSKFAFEAWSDALRAEVAPFGVRVAIMEPGNIKTEIWKKGFSYKEQLLGYLNEEQRERYSSVLDKIDNVLNRQDAGGVSAELTADAAEDALTSDKPRIRYVVGNDARAALIARKLAPDVVFDRLVQFELKRRMAD